MSAATVASAVVIRARSREGDSLRYVGLVMRFELRRGPPSVQIATTLSRPLARRSAGTTKRTGWFRRHEDLRHGSLFPSLTSEAAHVPFRATISRLVHHHASLPHPHL